MALLVVSRRRDDDDDTYREMLAYEQLSPEKKRQLAKTSRDASVLLFVLMIVPIIIVSIIVLCILL